MRKQSLVLRIIIAVVLVVSGMSNANADQMWQLTFRYDSQSLTLIEAGRIPPVSKEIRTPGLIGAPVKVSYNLDWLDSQGNDVLSTTAQIPLGMRSTLGDNEPCHEIMPSEGVFVVRVAGPDSEQQPAAVRLTQTLVTGRAADRLSLPSVFESSMVLPIQRFSTEGLMRDGPVNAEKIRDTGPDGNRLVIVIMGDGYTSDNLAAGEFETDAAGLEDDFELKAPWDVLLAATNFYRVDIESNEEGADHEVYGVYKDTYLNSSFWVNNIERLLALTGDGYSRAISAANSLVGVGVWDVILVLVNSTKYGGSGGSIAVSSVHSSGGEIVLHELGHSFAGLADEYETPYPGYPPGDWEPNVDYDYDGPGLKWMAWVEPETPLPTPENSGYANVVGTFEGARYLSSGIYRPWYICLMRSLGVAFGPVCQETHILEFMDIVILADDVVPEPLSSQEIDDMGTTFTIDPLPVAGLDYEWLLDGSTIPDASGPELTLTADDLDDSLHTLDVVITFQTDLVRIDTISESFGWNLVNVGSCCKGYTGNIDCDADDKVDVSDLTELIMHLFISYEPLCCVEEANLDAEEPVVIDVSDLTALIDHLFINYNPTVPCP